MGRRYGRQDGNIVEVKNNKGALLFAFGAGAAIGAAGLYAYQNRQRIAEMLENKVRIVDVDEDMYDDELHNENDSVPTEDPNAEYRMSEEDEQDLYSDDFSNWNLTDEQFQAVVDAAEEEFNEEDNEDDSIISDEPGNVRDGERIVENDDSADPVEKETPEEVPEMVTAEPEPEVVVEEKRAPKKKTNRELTIDLLKTIEEAKGSPSADRLAFIEEELETFNVPKNLKAQVTRELNALKDLVNQIQAEAAATEALTVDRAKSAVFNVKELMEAGRPKEAHELFRRELTPFLANEEFLADKSHEDLTKEIFHLEKLTRETVISATLERSRYKGKY